MERASFIRAPEICFLVLTAPLPVGDGAEPTLPSGPRLECATAKPTMSRKELP